MDNQARSEEKKTLFLFDVDGTLTPSREKVTEEMLTFLRSLKDHGLTGFVGGSDLCKQKEQLGEECLKLFDFCFPENGLHFIKNGQEVSSQSYLEYVGEPTHTKLVNKIMQLMSEIDLPVKRGNFIELRSSMVNISPVGRSCSKEERKSFCAYDKEHKVREKMVTELKKDFGTVLTFSIGGEISIDIFPIGWDKTYCLNHLAKEAIGDIHFFGDMTHQGGNDYEISTDARVFSHTVTSPADTIVQVKEVIASLGHTS
ncbi:phosphomannomutase [Nematocida displodere]|uniref:Phosphomannomutase n=1 Tax=Nematocida displodere TaxID=1805483 RepID=A0A177EIZ4_9MICR|nr:phosphomannomutase [Nematocida displodere]